eukprot:11198543-Lingulodinium_polyedra.AAC.1
MLQHCAQKLLARRAQKRYRRRTLGPCRSQPERYRPRCQNDGPATVRGRGGRDGGGFGTEPHNPRGTMHL